MPPKGLQREADAVARLLVDDLTQLNQSIIRPDGGATFVDLDPEREKRMAARFEQLLSAARRFPTAIHDPIEWGKTYLVDAIRPLAEYRQLLPLLERISYEKILQSSHDEPSGSPSSVGAGAQAGPGAKSEDGATMLGKWAEQLLPEAKQFARVLRSGERPEDLREHFQRLFNDVLDKLYPAKREKFFEEAQRRMIAVPELVELLGQVKQISGSYLQDCRKSFRRVTGTARERPPRKHPNKHS